MPAQNSEYDKVLQDIIRYTYHGEISSHAAYQRARVALLDALGCACETLHLSPDCRRMIGPTVTGTIVPGGCRIPCTGEIIDPVKGAFDIGTLIRYLDHNDAYPGKEWGHPSDNLGAIIAITDWLSQGLEKNRPTLYTLLTAQIKAYEIQGVLQQHNCFNAYGLDHTILVKIASTAVCAWLLGLPESAALASLSHAWIDGHPLRTFRQSPNVCHRKGWAAGDACMRAVHLVMLAYRSGSPTLDDPWSEGLADGAPSAITAPKWGFSDALLGGQQITQSQPFASFVMETVFFKLITAEGHGISAVEAAVQLSQVLRARNLLAERDIQAITIRTQKPAMTIIDKTGPLKNAADRDHCLRYMVGVVLLKGSVIETEDYLDNSLWASDPRVDKLREKITVREDPGFTADYFDSAIRSAANAISIMLTSGEILDEVCVEFPVGHPKREDTMSRVMDKFHHNMSHMFEEAEIERVIQAVEKDSMLVHEFFDLFIRNKHS